MKKYLINGLLALVAGGFAASCADHDVDYVPLAQQKNQAYDQAFKEMIGGEVDPNQNWGFEDVSAPEDFDPAAARANTRNNGQDGAINVNGNMWYECPGVRVNEEVDAIFNYVKNGTEWMTANNKPFSTTAPENLNGYFVTQVRSGNNNYADNTYTNIYNNNQEVKNVGSWMNHLQIAFNENPSMADLNNATTDNVSGWEHINNFNGSSNIDWGASDSQEKGNTKVENKGAYDFAYYNSLDSKYHNKWILVDGANISSDPYYADFYYVCFDFESVPSTNKTHYHYKDANGQTQNGELAGTYFTNEEVAAELARTGVTGRTDIDIYRWEQGDKMLKGDNVYSDWIVRITKGEPNEEPVTYRVIAEDLNAREITDFDFNDVVFDVEPNDAGNAAKIVLRAAGGIYKLTVGNAENGVKEVHEAFAEAYPGAGYGLGENGLYPMINTNPWNHNVKVTLFDAYIGDFSSDEAIRNTIRDIKIRVYKPEAGEDGIELEAQRGKAACKILVDTRFEVVRERRNIADENELFTDYVSGAFHDAFWWIQTNN